jgi:hypothetical protein
VCLNNEVYPHCNIETDLQLHFFLLFRSGICKGSHYCAPLWGSRTLTMKEKNALKEKKHMPNWYAYLRAEVLALVVRVPHILALVTTDAEDVAARVKNVV